MLVAGGEGRRTIPPVKDAPLYLFFRAESETEQMGFRLIALVYVLLPLFHATSASSVQRLPAGSLFLPAQKK